MSRSAVMRRVALVLAVMMVVLGVAPSIAYGAAGEKSDNGSSDNAFFEFMFSQLETVTTKGVAVHKMDYSAPTPSADTAPGESTVDDESPSGFPSLTLADIKAASETIYSSGTYTKDGSTYTKIALITQYRPNGIDDKANLVNTYASKFGIIIQQANIWSWPSGHFSNDRVGKIFTDGTIVLIEASNNTTPGKRYDYNIVTDEPIGGTGTGAIANLIGSKTDIAVFGVKETSGFVPAGGAGDSILEPGNPIIKLHQLEVDDGPYQNKNLNLCVNSTNIIIDGIIFDGGGRENRANSSNNHLLTVSSSDNVILRNMALQNVKNSTALRSNDLYIANSSVFIDGFKTDNLLGNNEVADITFSTPKTSYVKDLNVSASTRQYPININDAANGVAFTDLTINDKIPIRIDKAATEVNLPIDDARPFLVIDNGKYLYFPTYSAAKAYVTSKNLTTTILDASVGYYMIDAKSGNLSADVGRAIAAGGSGANIKLVIDGTDMPTADLSSMSIGTLFPIDTTNADIPGFPANYNTFFVATYGSDNYNFKVGDNTTLYNVNYATTTKVVAATESNPIELYAKIGAITLVHCSYYYGTPELKVISVIPQTHYEAGGNSVVKVETEYLDNTKVQVKVVLDGTITEIDSTGNVTAGFTIEFPPNGGAEPQVYSIWTSIDGSNWVESNFNVTVLSSSVSIIDVDPPEHGPTGDDSDVTFSAVGIDLGDVQIRAFLDSENIITGEDYKADVDVITYGHYTLNFPANNTREDKIYSIESSTDSGTTWVSSGKEVTVFAPLTNLDVEPKSLPAGGGISKVIFDKHTSVHNDSIMIKAVNKDDDTDVIETDTTKEFKLDFAPNATATDKVYEIYTQVGNGVWVKSELIVTVTAASISDVTVNPTSQPQTGGTSMVDFDVVGAKKNEVEVRAVLPDGTEIKGTYNTDEDKFDMVFPLNNTYSNREYTIQTKLEGGDWVDSGVTVSVPGRRNTGGGGTTTTSTPTPTPTPSPTPIVTITPEPSIPLGSPTPAPTQSTGWQQPTGTNGPSYIFQNGSLAKGWNKLTPPGGGEAVWYYFDENGYAKSGWLLDGKNSGGVGTPAGSERWYYLYPAAGGTASKPAYSLAIGWNHLHWKGVDNWYYFKTDGVMYVGWLKNGKNADGTDRWFYLKPNRKGVQPMGSMNTGWVKISGMWYYCSDSGAMQTGWVLWKGNWYYLKTSGAMVANDWQQVGGKWYWFNSSGAMVTGTQTINGKTYRFNTSGAWIS